MAISGVNLETFGNRILRRGTSFYIHLYPHFRSLLSQKKDLGAPPKMSLYLHTRIKTAPDLFYRPFPSVSDHSQQFYFTFHQKNKIKINKLNETTNKQKMLFYRTVD